MSIEYTPPTPDEYAKMNWLSKAYYWFWHDVCHRPEPFTYTMRRSARDYPVYWIVIPGVLSVGLWLILCWRAGMFDKVKENKAWLWLIILPPVAGVAFWLLVVHLWGIL